MDQLLLKALMVLVPMVLSLTVHEYAHAMAARRLGDDTAEKLGRLTLNPLAHADPVGTFLLPLAMLTMGGGLGFFGWAKPVPVNAGRFSRKISVRTGMLLVALAGPLSNLALALVTAAALSLTWHFGVLGEGALKQFLLMMLGTNIGLFVFNMIPIHPLDGQKVLSGLLSAPAALKFERFNYQFGWMALMAVIVVGRDVLAWPVLLVRAGLLHVVGLGS